MYSSQLIWQNHPPKHPMMKFVLSMSIIESEHMQTHVFFKCVGRPLKPMFIDRQTQPHPKNQ
jgi:hypothetical protein